MFASVFVSVGERGARLKTPDQDALHHKIQRFTHALGEKCTPMFVCGDVVYAERE